MVTVPIYNMRQVQVRPDVQQGVDVRATPGAFGAAIGQGMQDVGQGLGQAADAFGQLRDFEDKLKSKDALTGYERELIDLQYGENGYLTTQGGDAVERQEQYARDLADLKAKHGSALKGGAARYFEDAATSAETGALRTGVVHAAQGRKDWAASSSTARLSLYGDQALSTYADPKAVDKALVGGFMEIDAQADLMGWGPDVIEVKRQEFATGVYSSVALALASETGGATKALTYLKEKSELIDPATRMDLEAKLTPYANDEAAMAVVDEILGMGRATDEAPAAAADGTVGAGGPTGVKSRLYARAGSAGKGADHVDGLTESFATNLDAMFQDAPPAIRDGLQIGSGYRSEARQAEIIAENMGKYGMGDQIGAWNADVAAMGPVAAGQKWASQFSASGLRKNVGMPGGSNHQHGNAVDIWYNGVRLDKAPAEVREWVHANAEAYGLRFPMSWESWHIEPSGARDGGAGATVVPARDGVSARAGMASYDAAIARVNEIEDPAVRAAAMKQLNAQFEMRGKAESAAATAAKSEMWSLVAQGTPMSAIPLDLKIAAGREAVQGFMDYEGKSGEITTDPILQRDLTLFAATNPVEFAKVDLTAPELINGLSKSDLKSLIDKQASVLTDERKAKEEGLNVSSAMGYAKTQLEAVGITSVGTEGADRTAAAKREADFQMALADEMRVWSEANAGKQPTQVDIMAMTNRLLLPIVIKTPGTIWDSEETGKMAFEAGSRADGTTVDVVVEYGDIPLDLRRGIATDLELELGRKPSDEEVVQRYEEFVLAR